MCSRRLVAGTTPEEAEASPVLAPAAAGAGGTASGATRMPDLRATIRADQLAGRVRVTMRVAIVKPRLLRGLVHVRISIPSLHLTRDVSIRPGDEQRHTLTVVFPVDVDASGRAVVGAIDPADQVLEARERNNRARTVVR